MVDPGFPQGGGTNSPGGAPTYDLAIFPKNLHEIERVWTPRGARPLHPPLDPPLLIVLGDGRWTVDGYVIISVYLYKTPVTPSPWTLLVT